jgi:hypothetical protein
MKVKIPWGAKYKEEIGGEKNTLEDIYIRSKVKYDEECSRLRRLILEKSGGKENFVENP